MQTDPTELQEALAVNSGGQRINPFDLDVVKLPSQGMTIWTIPDLVDGELHPTTIEGIVILQRRIRSYWAKGLDEKDGGGSSPPDCSSQDGLIGVGAPIGHPDFDPQTADLRYDTAGKEVYRGRFACEACPLATFGSAAKGNGQACKQNTLLFVLTPESSLPIVVKVPPSSLKPIQSFMLRLSGKGIPMYGAVIGLSLRKVQNSTGIDYSEIVPAFVSRLSPEETERMKLVHESMKPLLMGVEIEADD
jgi:hypothetical protein